VGIAPLSAGEIPEYIRHRWSKAGGAEPPFSPDAVGAICRASQGIPRVINVVCDNALIHACGDGSASVEVRHVLAACRDMRLIKNAPPSAPAIEAPAPIPVVAVEAYPMKTLERYRAAAAHPSLVARLAGKLGFSQRTETL
jgi:general secretion pathway protein A